MTDECANTNSEKKGTRRSALTTGHFFIKSSWKVYAKCLKKRCRELVEPQLQDAQCRFRPGRSTIDQIFALQHVFEKLWNMPKSMLYTCFVDLEKAYDRVSRDKPRAVMLEYDVKGQLLAAIKSLYKQSEVCVRVNGMKTKPFSVSVGLRQSCVLSCYNS